MCRSRILSDASLAVRLTSTERVPAFFFFFNDTATTEIYTLSLHDALPIFSVTSNAGAVRRCCFSMMSPAATWKASTIDRKSTRLNSSHDQISYAVFCLKKKILSNQPRDYRAGHRAFLDQGLEQVRRRASWR